MAYRIVRFYAPHIDKANKVIETDLTLKEAQDHCRDPDTRTDEYFDGYEKE